jgi:hypothetical protein
LAGEQEVEFDALRTFLAQWFGVELATLDCHRVPNGPAEWDCAGVCGGDAVRDCDGTCNGGVYVDSCGVCGGFSLCEDTVVDCVGDWGVWDAECSKTCGGGVQSRAYAVTVEATHGSACAAAVGDTQERPCNEQLCDNDCEGEWSAWSACSAECGGGERQRTYAIASAAVAAGAACPHAAADTETEACNSQACALEPVPWPPSNGFDAPDECSRGQYIMRSGGSGACTACATLCGAGHFFTVCDGMCYEDTACRPCDAGQYSPGGTVATCTDCVPSCNAGESFIACTGTGGTDNACTPCNAGQYSPGGTVATCTDCVTSCNAGDDVIISSHHLISSHLIMNATQENPS